MAYLLEQFAGEVVQNSDIPSRQISDPALESGVCA
jgi:hypothetical protein